MAYSRLSFVWPTFSQKLVDVIEGLEAAWAFFEGVPKYLVIDNVPAAVADPDRLHPRLTRGFLEYSQHRGFIADPARVRHPRDKPRVERGVPYVRERFFKGGTFTDLADMRSEARRWCVEVAGQRVHGTTRRQPLAVFRQEERSALGDWYGEPYEMTDWRTVKVHPDHHVACQYALYSVPSEMCPPGQKVEVRLGSKLVRIYYRGRLILDEEERQTLERWVRRPKTAQALALRARIILGCADGQTNMAVAAQLRVSKPTVGKWGSRFLEQRLDELVDEPCSGRPRTVSDADVERVLALTLETMPEDSTHWSTRSMARRCGLSQSTVSRIWQAFALATAPTETLQAVGRPSVHREGA